MTETRAERFRSFVNEATGGEAPSIDARLKKLAINYSHCLMLFPDFNPDGSGQWSIRDANSFNELGSGSTIDEAIDKTLENAYQAILDTDAKSTINRKEQPSNG